MATILTLAWRTNVPADIETLDLLNFAAGFDLAESGWVPQVSVSGENVIEVITLHAKAATNDALAAAFQQLDLFKKRVMWSHSVSEMRYVALRAAMQSETNPREATIVKFDYALQTSLYSHTAEAQSMLFDVALTIERTPFWEPTTSTQNTGVDVAISGNIGGAAEWNDSINGDVPARLSELNFTLTMSGSVKPAQAWIGFKSNQYGGTPANFVPYWPLAPAAWKETDTTASTDGHGRDIIQCDFSTGATLKKRAMLQVGEVSPSNPTDQIGKYVVLLAAKCDSGTVARARLAFSNGPVSNFVSPIYRSRVVVSDTDWITQELGSISIPASYMRQTALEDYSRFALSLEAERLSGSGKLYAYGFFLIPMDAMIRVRNAGYGYTGAGSPDYGSISTPVTIFQRANNELISHGYTTNFPSADYVMQPIDWGLPANDGKPYVVMALEKGYGNAGNNGISITYKYTRRWRTLRGAE